MQCILVSLLRSSKFCYRFGKSLETAEEKGYKCVSCKILDQNMQFRNATNLEIKLFQSVQSCFERHI